MKKPKKYVTDFNKLPKTECRIKDCHKDKKNVGSSYCVLHEDRMKGIWKSREEYVAERLMT